MEHLALHAIEAGAERITEEKHRAGGANSVGEHSPGELGEDHFAPSARTFFLRRLRLEPPAASMRTILGVNLATICTRSS